MQFPDLVEIESYIAVNNLFLIGKYSSKCI